MITYCKLGRTEFGKIWELQKKLHFYKQINKKSNDLLLITEHENVYTLGKSGDKNHLLKTENASFYEIDRGGDITFHGPGQLVCYPIFDLDNYYHDAHRFLRDLEEVVINTLNELGIKSERDVDYTGVWVGEEKICAIGIKLSRWISMHGLALNVNSDLKFFDNIIPCGIFHKGVTSVKNQLNREILIEDVIPLIVKNFEKVFGVNSEEISPDELTVLAESTAAKY
jgi:lipoyl(octanoyl) transferase